VEIPRLGLGSIYNPVIAEGEHNDHLEGNSGEDGAGNLVFVAEGEHNDHLEGDPGEDGAGEY
jgi:hypothetical protein